MKASPKPGPIGRPITLMTNLVSRAQSGYSSRSGRARSHQTWTTTRIARTSPSTTATTVNATSTASRGYAN